MMNMAISHLINNRFSSKLNAQWHSCEKMAKLKYILFYHDICNSMDDNDFKAIGKDAID